MKKFLLSLVALLATLGAWAAVTQPETGVYVISGDENGRRGNLAACDGISDFPALSNINWSGTNYGNNSVDAITNGEHWYVLKVYNRYVIYNLGLNKYLVKEGNDINFGDTPYLWQILVNGNYNSIYDEVGTYISFACGTKPSSTTRNVKFNNSSTDGGSLHTFTVVGGGERTYADQIINVTENAPIELSYELTDELGNVYTGMYAGFAGTDLPTLTGITFTSTRWENNKLFADITFPFPVSDAETTKKMMINGYTYSNQDFKWYAKDNTKIKVNEDSAPTVDNVNNYLWAIYPSVNEDVFTYAIKNVATGKYITSSATTGAHADNTLGFSDTGISFTLVKDSWGYAFKIADKNLYLSINSSQDGIGEQPLGLHGNTHDGTSLSFIPYVVNYTITDEANNTYTGEGEGWAGLQIEPVFTGAAGYTLTDKVWDGNTFTANITFPFPVSKDGGVTNATMITSFKNGYTNGVVSYQYGFKWYASGDAVKFKRLSVATVPTLNYYSWAIYPKMENSQFTFAIKNVSTDKYISTNADYSQGNGSDVAGTVILQETPKYFFINGTDGYIYYVGETNKINHYLSAATNSKADEMNLGVWAKTHNGATTEFIPQSFVVNVGESGYASLYTPIAGTFSEGVKSYAVKETSSNSAKLDELTGIQADQGAIIEAAEGTYTFTAGDVDSDWTGNKLKGSITNTYVQGDAYVLSAPDGVESVGLYKAELNKDANGDEGNTHFKNNAGKAYLPASAVPASARFLSFDFGGNETAIESVESETATDAVVYDLAGRRVKAAQKGLYIVNGKVVIK